VFISAILLVVVPLLVIVLTIYDNKSCYGVMITWIALLGFLPTYRAAVAIQLTTVTVIAGWGVKYWTLQYRT